MERIIGTNDAPEDAAAGIGHIDNMFVINKDFGVADNHRGTGYPKMGKTFDGNFITYALIKGAHLAIKKNFAAS